MSTILSRKSLNEASETEAQPPHRIDLRPASRRVSVVVVVWNAQKYVIECLDSLQQQCDKLDLEVIVVDNASSDGTPELVAQRYPGFHLIRNSENVGFAKANNIGIGQSSGEYVCLVNSDVKFTDDCITPMLEYLAGHSDVAMLGPKMLAADGHVRRSTMRFPTLWNSFCRSVGLDILFKHSRFFGGLLMADFDHRTTAEVEVLNGWFLVVRRSALQRVGVWDPAFFMYGEDIDWCYRFRQAGEKIVFFAGAEAIHYGGASSANAPIRFQLEMWRASLQYWQKHHGWLAQQMYLVSLALHHGLRLLGALAKYLLLPGQRENTRLKIDAGVACLRWVGQMIGRPSPALGYRYSLKNVAPTYEAQSKRAS
ncbi:MAG TPA: glycosyltransferase family 2 protein [Terriglobales bacterium]|nr:glycosyltransferase family 2 protein [Terriglobales bacterium]